MGELDEGRNAFGLQFEVSPVPPQGRISPSTTPCLSPPRSQSELVIHQEAIVDPLARIREGESLAQSSQE